MSLRFAVPSTVRFILVVRPEGALVLTLCILQAPALFGQAPMPQWCRALPHPEYKNLEHVSISNPWFEVYRPTRGVFAIYEPHQAEETISYLVVGEERALLFDTGMGNSDIKKVTVELTNLPIIRVELAHSQRSRRRQLGILYDLRHGLRLYASECAGFSGGCADRNYARSDLWRAADGV
jgi:hypothetical protein